MLYNDYYGEEREELFDGNDGYEADESEEDAEESDPRDKDEIDEEEKETGGRSDTLDSVYDIKYFGQRWVSDNTAERIEKMYADMQSANSLIRTRGENAFVAELETLIKQLVATQYRQYQAKYGADMVQEAMMYCFGCRFNFNPGKGAFSTYFTYAADTAIKTYISEYIKHETRYESRIDAQVAKSITRLGETVDEREITPAMIEVDTGLSTAVVQAALARRSTAYAPLLGLEEHAEVQIAGPEYDPVESYNNLEAVRQFWEEAKSLLTEAQYQQLVMHYVQGMESKQICEKLGITDRARWILERRALQKLAQSKLMRSFAGKTDDVNSDAYIATAGATLSAIRKNMASFFETNIEEGDSY